MLEAAKEIANNATRLGIVEKAIMEKQYPEILASTITPAIESPTMPAPKMVSTMEITLSKNPLNAGKSF